MPARAGSTDPEMIRIHTPLPGVVSDEPHRAVNVGNDFGDREFWLRTMHDRENRIPAIEEGLVKSGIDRLVRRKPSATDHENNPVAVRVFGRLENIQRQRDPGFPAVDHVLNAGDVGGRLAARRRKHLADKKEDEDVAKAVHGWWRP